MFSENLVAALSPSIRGLLRPSRISAAQVIPENVFLFDDAHAPAAAPRSIECDPVDTCNHQCPWCFTRPYRGNELADCQPIADTLRAFSESGGISVHFSGGGEPLLWKPIRQPQNALGGKTILEFASELGLYSGLITNGLLLDQLPPLERVPLLAFVRVSLDSIDSVGHAQRHACSEQEFPKIIDALRNLVIDRQRKLTPGIGVSVIVDPSRSQFIALREFQALADLASNIGLDFVQIKHVHSSDEAGAEAHMRRIADIVAGCDWGDCEPWVHRYEAAKPAQLCRVTRLIEAVGAPMRKYPCCHLFGRVAWERTNDLSDRATRGCTSQVCRYRSINDVLDEAQDADSLAVARERLHANLASFGFHPFRLFPSAPRLFGDGLA